MEPFCYCVGLDVHRKIVAYCIKKADGTIVRVPVIGEPSNGETVKYGQHPASVVFGLPINNGLSRFGRTVAAVA